DIIAGSGDSSEVRVFNGANLAGTLTFQAFNTSSTGGVRVGVSDANADGRPDIVAAAGPGGGEVRLFDGRTGAQLGSVTPYGARSTSGTFAAGVPGPPAGGVTPFSFSGDVTVGAVTPTTREDGTSGPAGLRFTRSGDTTDGLQVFYSWGGTATVGVDFTFSPNGTSGSII